MALLTPPAATKVTSPTGISRQTGVSRQPEQGLLPRSKPGLRQQITLRRRQHASKQQPKEEIPGFMIHCFEQILTLASQHFSLYPFSRSPESYIILQSSQYRQNKLDKLDD